MLEGIINPDCVVLFHSVWKLGQNLIQRLASYLKLTHLFITPILATLHWLPLRYRISVFEHIFEYEAQIHIDARNYCHENTDNTKYYTAWAGNTRWHLQQLAVKLCTEAFVPAAQ